MRKRMIAVDKNKIVMPDGDWLNLEEVAEVEISSEELAYPIECALLANQSSGWRAADSGKQIIRLLFAKPQQLKRICLCFTETNTERTQEFRIRCLLDNSVSFQEVVRQQWNFSPSGATCETEDYSVNLATVKVFELHITPDINNPKAFATLAQLRLA